MVIGPGRCELHRLPRLGAQEPGILDEDRACALDGADHYRNVRVVAIANAHGLLVFEVNPFERLDERGDEMPPRLLHRR